MICSQPKTLSVDLFFPGLRALAVAVYYEHYYGLCLALLLSGIWNAFNNVCNIVVSPCPMKNQYFLMNVQSDAWIHPKENCPNSLSPPPPRTESLQVAGSGQFQTTRPKRHFQGDQNRVNTQEEHNSVYSLFVYLLWPESINPAMVCFFGRKDQCFFKIDPYSTHVKPSSRGSLYPKSLAPTACLPVFGPLGYDPLAGLRCPLF